MNRWSQIFLSISQWFVLALVFMLDLIGAQGPICFLLLFHPTFCVEHYEGHLKSSRNDVQEMSLVQKVKGQLKGFMLKYVM